MFRTEINITPWIKKISYHHSLAFVGSCFSENIGNKFLHYKWHALVNPFGTVYNPVSLSRIITQVTHKKTYTVSDLVFYNAVWHSLHHHSLFSSEKEDEIINKLHQIQENFLNFIQKADFMFITLGTSWVYEWKKTGEVISNCHKIPGDFFTKRLLSPVEIEQSIEKIIEDVSSINKNIRFIFTISPVRHIKDGFFENNVSKALLFSSIFNIIQKKSENTEYFPAYELLMDDLRDYRFYSSDLLHPNELGIQYIWEKIKIGCIDGISHEYMHDFDKIFKNLQHKAFHEKSRDYILHLEKTNNMIHTFEKKYQKEYFTEDEKNVKPV